METFKDRLEFLFGKDAGPTKISKEIGMAYAGFSRVWYEGGIPKAETLIKIQEVTNCNLNWLLTGLGQPYLSDDRQEIETKEVYLKSDIVDTLGNPIDVAEDFVFIPHYDVYASAGHGYGVEHETPLFPLAFRRYWLQTYVSNRFEQLSVIVVRGDSMDGVLNDGDTILVNHTDTSPKDDIYVIRIDSDIFVKRIQRLPNKLLVISENDNYETFTIDLTQEQQNFAILGRVVWLGRML